MPIFPGMRDIGLSLDGDLMFNDNGDLATVSGDQWVVHEINKRVRTTNPGWLLHPNVGAGVETFCGRPNTRNIGMQIEHAIHRALTIDGFLLPGAIRVQVVPTSLTSISAFITVTSPGQQSVTTQLIFDMTDGLTRILDPSSPQKAITPEDFKHQESTNKYTSRRR